MRAEITADETATSRMLWVFRLDDWLCVHFVSHVNQERPTKRHKWRQIPGTFYSVYSYECERGATRAQVPADVAARAVALFRERIHLYELADQPKRARP